jgi:Sec-independent protein translocase protein TatA
VRAPDLSAAREATSVETVQIILGVIILLFFAVEVQDFVRNVARGFHEWREKRLK